MDKLLYTFSLYIYNMSATMQPSAKYSNHSKLYLPDLNNEKSRAEKSQSKN